MKCQNCGSNEIESDSTRADSVCTKCGTVCESGIIVSDVQFEENAHGGTSALRESGCINHYNVVLKSLLYFQAHLWHLIEKVEHFVDRQVIMELV